MQYTIKCVRTGRGLMVMIGASVLALVLVLVLVLVPLTTRANARSLEPLQVSVVAGQRVEFVGRGFSNERVAMWATAPDQSVFSAGEVDAPGSPETVLIGFDVPFQAMSGRWAFTAHGKMSGVSEVAYFDVVESGGAVVEPQVNRPLRESFALEPVRGTVVAGERLEFVGSGFDRGEPLSVWLTDPSQVALGGREMSAADDGTVTIIGVEVPVNGLAGRWALTVQGAWSQVPVITTFEVVGASAETGLLEEVSPLSGPVGTEFRFVANGFAHGERASYWLTGPDGLVFATYEGQVRSDGHGQLEVWWSAPTGAPAGRWVVTMQGLESGVSRMLSFEMF